MGPRNISRKKKGISTFIATLLLIVLVVAAGVLIYAYTMGYLGGFGAPKGNPNLQVQSSAELGDGFHIYAKNIGAGSLTLDRIYVNDGWVDVPSVTGVVIPEGETHEIVIPPDLLQSDMNGRTSDFKIMAVGGTFTSVSSKINGGTGGGGVGTYTVSFSYGSGGVSVSPSGSHSYNPGDLVAILATADGTHLFSQWIATGSITFVDENAASTTATINGAGTITTSFVLAPVQYSVQFILGSGGDSMNPTAGTHSYAAGTEVPIEAFAASGYVFQDWTFSGSIVIGDAGSASTTATINDAGTVTANFVVGMSNPTISTTVTPASPVIEGTVHDSAILTGATATAEGSVTYSLYRGTAPGTLVDSDIKTVANGLVPDSKEYALSSLGSYYFVAEYSGDVNNNGVTGDPEVFTVGKTSPGVSTVFVPASPTLGGTVHDTATLSGVTSTAGGTVTYSLYRGAAPGTLVDSDIKTVTDGAVPDSKNFAISATGDYYLVVEYSGDANNNAASNSDEVFSVASSGSTTTTLLSDSSITIGESVTDVATVTVSGPAATGTVAFEVSGDGGVTWLPYGLEKTLSGGTATSDPCIPTAVGDYKFRALYSGDTNYSSSQSGDDDEPLTVDKASPTLATTPPSVAVVGVPFTDSAALTGATTNAGGTVTYSLYSGIYPGGVLEGTPSEVIVVDGVVPVSDPFTVTTAGSYYFTASYSGDDNNNAVSVGVYHEDFSVGAGAATTLVVAGFPDPTTAGTAGSITVTAKDASGNTATGYRGTVHFTSSDPSPTLPANYVFVAGDNGAHTFAGGVTLRTVGEQSITATDTVTGTITGSQTAITVNPGALDHFVFNTIGTQTAGTAFSITITAKDASENTVTSYTGTNDLTVSSGTISPTTTGAFTAGVRSDLFVTIYTTGSITIRTTGATKTGTSNSFTVNAGSGTFGNTATGSSSYQRSIEDTIVGSIFTTPGYSVTAQSISAYVHVTGTFDMKAAIYTTGGDRVGSSAGTQQVSVTTSTDDQFVLFTYAAGTQPTLAANTQYVILVWADEHGSSNAFIYGSSNSGLGRYENENYDGTFPSDVGSGWDGSNTVNYSIYCTYSIP